jgi:2-polyprenyl-3-methyl-5-hydroxy-6-metoxy-1,4-benzoquinol methylase
MTLLSGFWRRVGASRNKIRTSPTSDSSFEGTNTFDQPEAISINQARLVHLESLQLPVKGKNVIDVGCGVGHLAQYFVRQECNILCIDARKDNIDSLRVRYPTLTARVFNLEEESVEMLGNFEIVFCYGLLYHLENPYSAVQKLRALCKEVLLLETIICDYPEPLLILERETSAFSQAVAGIGSRPTPSYVNFILRRSGFTHVYIPLKPPAHPDFLFERRNNLEWRRNGHNLRCIFVASFKEIKNEMLVKFCDTSSLSGGSL